MLDRFSAESLFDLDHCPHPVLFDGVGEVWSVLALLKGFLADSLKPEILGEVAEGAFVGEEVFLGEGSVVEAGATIKGPVWIGKNCTVRAGAYVRENVIVGDGVMMGNSSEFKNCLIHDNAEVPHFNYVGDSILGYKAHLGAGVILSNVRLDRGQVGVRLEDGTKLDTGLRKFGAMVGDRTEVGCNSVLSPGSVMGKDCIVYPGTQWSGVLPSDSMVKLRQDQEVVRRNG